MPRDAKYVRIKETPDGSVRRVQKGGREIHGLHYRRTTRKGTKPERGVYYTYRVGSRHDLGSDLADATRIVENRPEPLPEWADPAILPPEVEERIKAGKGPISDQTLSDCLDEWRKARRTEGVTDEHIDDVARYFRAFVRCVGDLPVSELTAEHFTAYRNSVSARRSYRDAKGKPKKHSVLWVERHHKWVKHVLKYIKWSYPSWGLPDGVLEWASAYQVISKREKYNSPKKNRQRIPVDAFKKLVAVAETWAYTPIDGDKHTQSGRAKRNQQRKKRLEGLRVAAMVKLAANCGLGNVDVMRIRWSNLRLDDEIPHMDFPRRKTEDVTGEVERYTPLLPETIRALQTVKAIGNPSPFVFVTGGGKAYTKPSFRQMTNRLFATANTKAWTFKHLRNIGGTLAKRNGYKDRVQEFLGHNETGTNKFYVDDVGPEYMVPVVNLIGREYFDGDEFTPRGIRVVHSA